jgi:H/ACA ribonucleoprotein complex subunit 2
LAGDISPMDVITHIPVLCEESNVPYCYVPSKLALGQAGSTRRPTSVVMLPLLKKTGSEYEDVFDACIKEIKGLPILPSVLA